MNLQINKLNGDLQEILVYKVYTFGATYDISSRTILRMISAYSFHDKKTQ